MIEFLETGIISPIFAFLRSTHENQCILRDRFLSLSEEERKEEQDKNPGKYADPIYEERPCIDRKGGYRNCSVCVGFTPWNDKDCQEWLHENRSDHLYYNIIETIAKMGLSSRTVKIVGSFPIPVYAYFNLSALDHIPPGLHNDAVFKRYVCPITGNPIRYPVGDPHDGTLYERAAIIQYVAQNKISYKTKLPLKVGQLVPKPALQLAIDTKLQFHQQRIDQIVRASLANNNPIWVQRPADVENPGY